MQLRGDRHTLRVIREFRLDGGHMHWIAQTTPESLDQVGPGSGYAREAIALAGG